LRLAVNGEYQLTNPSIRALKLIISGTAKKSCACAKHPSSYLSFTRKRFSEKYTYFLQPEFLFIVEFWQRWISPELHGVTTQKNTCFIAISVRTSHPAYLKTMVG
jgi:hypothetical protein